MKLCLRLICVLLPLAVAVPALAQYDYWLGGKNKVRYDQFDWKVYETPHFRISYYDRVEPTLPRIASFAESAYDELARKLNFQILCSDAEYAALAPGRKQLRMEWFYRDMRRKTGLLMEGDQPAGGQWNFDHDNRKPAKADLLRPRPRDATPDAVVEVLALVEARFSHFGRLRPFRWATDRAGALAAEKGLTRWALSLAHDGGLALAFVVAAF